MCDDEVNATNDDVISTYHQSFPTNGKVALIADVDGDGTNELVIASTDRVVRVFKWVKDEVKKGLCVRQFGIMNLEPLVL